MNEQKLNRIIGILRSLKEEGGMVVGAGGFTGSANPKGPVAGFDPVMGLTRRKKYASLGSGSRKRWMNKTPTK